MRHRHIRYWLATAGLLTTVGTATAQTSDELAAQWRKAMRDEIHAQIAALNTRLNQIDDRTTPESFARIAAATSISTPAPTPSSSPTSAINAADTTAADAKAEAAKAEAAKAEAAGSKAVVDKDKAKGPPGTFGGLAFGVGISLTLDIGKKDRIGSASLDPNRIVRIDDKNNSNARVMLESHYFFTPNGRGPFTLYNDPDERLLQKRGTKEWGFGPFIALQPGSGEIIDAVGLGIMAGFRRPGADSGSFNLGLGAVIDPNVRILGDGIDANRPLPAGETEVRYRETSQLGVLLLSSFTF